MRSLLLVLVLSGCSLFNSPDGLPDGATEMTTLFQSTPTIAALWRKIDSCSQHPRSMAGVRFYVVSESNFGFHVDGENVSGVYQPRFDRIILSTYVVNNFGSQAVSDRIIMHEFVHAHGFSGHADDVFGVYPYDPARAGACGALLGAENR